MIRITMIALAAVLAALLPAVVRAGGDEAHVQLTRAGKLADDAVVETYEVLDPMETLVLSVQVSLEDGTVAWTLTAPDGSTAWEGSGDTSGEAVEKTFAAQEGTWKLAFEPQSAAGRYKVRWRGDS